MIKDSPADKARFKAGDEIIAVGKNVSGNIQAYKNLLQTPNEEIKVIVKRGEKLLELSLYTLSIH